MEHKYKILLIFITGVLCGGISQIIEINFLMSFLLGAFGMFISLKIYKN